MEKDFKLFSKDQGINPLTLLSYSNALNTPTNGTPYILEKSNLNATQLDVFSRLMAERIIFLTEQVTDDTMSIIQAQLLYLDSQSDEDINIYINSPGGSVNAGLGLYDVMQFIKSDISTTIMGIAASMGSIISTSGTVGKRNSLKHSWLMIHDVSGGTRGKFLDMDVDHNYTKELRGDLFNILSNNSQGKLTPEEVEHMCKYDNWIRPNKGKEFGLIDNLI